MRSKKNSHPGSAPPGRSHENNTLRIIGGRWRGRKLSFPAEPQLRPTGDRLRETLFNWLAPSLPGARCLDLFAGSGALGLEALSRGAAACTMIDSSAAVCRALESHRRALAAENQMEIVHQNTLDWLQQQIDLSFDIIFLDPPFASTLHSSTLQLLEAKDRVAPETLLYIEFPSGQVPAPGNSWHILRSKQAGRVNYQLLEKTDEFG